MRRVKVTFWVLVAVAVLAAGALSASLRADSAPTTALAVAGSGSVLAAASMLALRIMIVVGRSSGGDRPSDR